MIVSVEPRHSELHARRGREAESPRKMHAPKAKSGRQEELSVSRILARVIKRGVRFQFRPKVPAGLVLKCGVPEDLPAQLVCVSRGHVDANRGLDIKILPTLT